MFSALPTPQAPWLNFRGLTSKGRKGRKRGENRGRDERSNRRRAMRYVGSKKGGAGKKRETTPLQLKFLATGTPLTLSDKKEQGKCL